MQHHNGMQLTSRPVEYCRVAEAEHLFSSRKLLKALACVAEENLILSKQGGVLLGEILALKNDDSVLEVCVFVTHGGRFIILLVSLFRKRNVKKCCCFFERCIENTYICLAHQRGHKLSKKKKKKKTRNKYYISNKLDHGTLSESIR